MLESNLPRNTQPETHRTDGKREGSLLLPFCQSHIGTIDFLMPKKTHRSGCQTGGFHQALLELLRGAIVQITR